MAEARRMRRVRQMTALRALRALWPGVRAVQRPLAGVGEVAAAARDHHLKATGHAKAGRRLLSGHCEESRPTFK